MSELLIVGAKSIAQTIGEGRNDIPRLVAQEGLPAWKKRGTWRALPEDLTEWLRKQREKNVQ